MSIREFITQTLANFSKSLEKVYIRKTDITDNLSSSDTTKPLSANQGTVLKNSIDTANSNFSKCPVNKYYVSQNISTTSGTQTNTITLESGSYIITQNHPTAPASLYHITCMSGYVGKVVPIIEDTNCIISVNAKLELTITTNSGGGNFRWWHIIKLSSSNSLNPQINEL